MKRRSFLYAITNGPAMKKNRWNILPAAKGTKTPDCPAMSEKEGEKRGQHFLFKRTDEREQQPKVSSQARMRHALQVSKPHPNVQTCLKFPSYMSQVLC
jgi:hypothetical protein